MKITKYRTVAVIYPYLSLECEVEDGDRKLYPNITINNRQEKEKVYEGSYWCYTKPMDMIGIDPDGNEIDYDKDYENSTTIVDKDIIRQMYEFWNSNPVFDNDKTWKEWR